MSSEEHKEESNLIKKFRTIEELAEITTIVRPTDVKIWRESSFTIVKDDEEEGV